MVLLIIVVLFGSNFLNVFTVQETSSYKNITQSLIFGKMGQNWTKYGRGCPASTGSPRSPRPPQKFGYRPKSISRLVSLKKLQ